MPDMILSSPAAVRVGLHDYCTDPLLPQRDGGNLAHENISQLARQLNDPALSIAFHDFPKLLADSGYARDALGALDCVFSNVGPHAHHYFHLREELGLDFRIIRDVRTAIWSSYLLQEHLCLPYLRSGDTLMAASAYTRSLYLKMFPQLARFPTAICYPLAICFPHERPPARRLPDDSITLGYLGRLSEDKNFPQIVDLLITLNQRATRGRRYRLLACGEPWEASCDPAVLQARICDALGEGDWFEFVPAISNGEIWPMLDRFDVMLFPSTSNLETFGRVLMEASFMRLPVVSADHAAAAELVDPSGLCPVEYLTGERLAAHFGHQLGRVPVDAMASAILSGELRASPSFDRYADDVARFAELLRTTPQHSNALALSVSQQAFLDRLVVDLPPPLAIEQADQAITDMRQWFLRLSNKTSADWHAATAALLDQSAYPERTRAFIAKAARTSSDFTNIGGIDLEMCHVARFYPQFSIRPEDVTP